MHPEPPPQGPPSLPPNGLPGRLSSLCSRLHLGFTERVRAHPPPLHPPLVSEIPCEARARQGVQ